MSENIHASCVAINNQAILFLGASGVGKSDLCLRLIMQKNALLVADDRVILSVENHNIITNSHPNISGLLEVRGLGIQSFPYQNNVCLSLVVELVGDIREIERLPEPDFYEFEGVKIKKIKLYAFENSAIDKILLALRH